MLTVDIVTEFLATSPIITGGFTKDCHDMLVDARNELERHESAMALRDRQVELLSAALMSIIKWQGEFPSTGDCWQDGSPISYGAKYGAHGERDYMRKKAEDALCEAGL